MESVKKLLKQLKANFIALHLTACTEKVEEAFAFIYIWWSISIDVTASPYYDWLRNTEMVYRVAAFSIGIFRFVSVLLGGKKIRFFASLLMTAFAITLVAGFGFSGWRNAAGSHLIFAYYCAWSTWRLYSRLGDQREEMENIIA